ncbi:MAG: class I SAM-dependent methyltransferase [Gammaproteobacteria bacterium]|uniref:class I SAM-dependent methyltransferase n=1 Tax=Azohydromonas sp. TaxID=1872666 RepID=UPI002CE1C62D|nr:class I SAM-dependent methyltransferase [Azohydromonas sp.]HMM85931.1 class I SAM-dependent methyltransferase [Azohydromonas sp.]
MDPAAPSVSFFDAQFRRQVRQRDFELNPFEREALPHLRGDVLDAGCGLGNLALAAAERGCSVLALDASPAAIEHLRAVAAARSLPLRAEQADLAGYAPPPAAFDAVVAIGLLMFFDCATARGQLARLLAAVRPGGVAVVNVLVAGTTWLEPFGDGAHCLLPADELRRAFAGWTLRHDREQAFDAAGGTVKRFVTVIAQRPRDG